MTSGAALALTMSLALTITMAIGQMPERASAADNEITTRRDLVYAEHDGVALVGDLYLPKGRNRAPILVAMHGGGWRGGDREFYRYWGPFLARHGYALFTIEYRLGASGAYPAAIYDVKAALQFARAKAAEFAVDPDRIGLMGDSAGAYVAALSRLRATVSPQPIATMPLPRCPST
jgi:acetyl esterase/lipase